jgi:hypothetical protein
MKVYSTRRRYTRRVSRVRRLAASASLTSFDLTQTWLRDSDIGGLASMPQLRELVLCGCPGVTDVRGLIASTSLVTLMLQGLPVTNAGISGLERMTQLKTLGLTRTKVDDVSFFLPAATAVADHRRRSRAAGGRPTPLCDPRRVARGVCGVLHLALQFRAHRVHHRHTEQRWRRGSKHERTRYRQRRRGGARR